MLLQVFQKSSQAETKKKDGKSSRIYFWSLSDPLCAITYWKALEQSMLLLWFVFVLEKGSQWEEDDFEQDVRQLDYVDYLNLQVSIVRVVAKRCCCKVQWNVWALRGFKWCVIKQDVLSTQVERAAVEIQAREHIFWQRGQKETLVHVTTPWSWLFS